MNARIIDDAIPFAMIERLMKSDRAEREAIK